MGMYDVNMTDEEYIQRLQDAPLNTVFPHILSEIRVALQASLGMISLLAVRHPFVWNDIDETLAALNNHLHHAYTMIELTNAYTLPRLSNSNMSNSEHMASED